MHKRCREIMDELILNGELEEITWFKFAPKQELKLRLKDMLEDEVDEKYLLKQYQVENISKSTFNQKKNIVTDSDKEFIGTLLSRDYKDPKVIRLKQTHTLNIKGNDSIKRIYSSDGHNPSLTTMQGGQREPKIDHPVREVGRRLDKNGKRCDDNKDIPITRRYEIGEKEISNCLSGVQKDSYVAIANGLIEVSDEVKVKEATKLGYKVAQTLDTACNQVVFRKVDEKYLISKNQIDSMSEYSKEKTFSNIKQLDGISSTITANPQRATIDNGNLIELDKYYNEYDKTKYIFRKLTPRECFRLQGFDDSFIFPQKMSDTQLYKQAGNGMSRNILDMIFTQIFTCYAKHIEKIEG